MEIRLAAVSTGLHQNCRPVVRCVASSFDPSLGTPNI